MKQDDPEQTNTQSVFQTGIKTNYATMSEFERLLCMQKIIYKEQKEKR
jgi:hypothetical protein